MSSPKISIIGGGSTGAAIAHDLASRGFDVTLIERGNLIGGTSGRFHGLLHSGARYAVKDQKAAAESIIDNKILSEIAPHCIQDTGGVFVELEGDDKSYAGDFEKGCKAAGIPAEQVDVKALLEAEPFLSKSIITAFKVPDKVINSFKLITSLMLTAKSEGAKIKLNTEVVGFDVQDKTIKDIKVKDTLTGKTGVVDTDFVINASGPWISRILDMLGINSVKTISSAGTMVVLDRKFSNLVVNRLRPPSDGDIIVPFFGKSIIGTTSFIAEDPDKVEIDEDDPKFLVSEGSKLIPAVKNQPIERYYAGVRPLIATGGEADSREVTRDFKIFDHEKIDGLHGIATIGGGKLSTCRQIGKEVSDVVAKKFGVSTPSKTDRIKLLWPELDKVDLSEVSKQTSIPINLLKAIVSESIEKTYSDIYSPAKDLVNAALLLS
ncbi:MAG: FAD-dependent oxidoreductase [Nitrososphaerota archaeon]|jgi:glycerol-3-phosphate dehydrogenase|nr:FAD-dependent oxidoreductase [Nitrososphaerota archaeon]